MSSSSSSPPSQQQPDQQPQQRQQSQQQREGIDFHQALAILSARGGNPHDNENADAAAACPCQLPHSAKANADFGNMGQILHLNNLKSQDKDGTTAAEPRQETSPSTNHNDHQQAARRRLLDQFTQMSTRQLLQAVLQAQQQRVATYRDYDR